MKEHARWSKERTIIKDMSQQSDDVCATRTIRLPMDFLGVEFGFGRKINRDGFRDLMWRQKKPSNAVAQALVQGDRTPKEVSSTIGRIIYSHLLGLKGLGPICEVIDILRRTTSCAWNQSWNTRAMKLTDEERVVLSKEWHLVTHPTWHIGSRYPESHEIGYVVTDACDDGFAYIVFSRDGRILFNSGQLRFDAKLQARCIYYKELHRLRES